MEQNLLADIVIILAVSAGAVIACHFMRLPSIVGFLLAGVLAGPQALGLISSAHEIEIMAEVGVVLLLFSIGLEFSFKRLLEIKRAVLLGGSLQVGLATAAAWGLAALMGWPTGPAVFMGFLLSLSSTAIVLKLYQERAEVGTPHGRASLAILVFQDIIVIPMLLAVPLLAGRQPVGADQGWLLAAKAVGVVALIWVMAKWVVPRSLNLVAGTRSRELFIICVVLMCLGVALLTSSVGLSLALGAFVAGLIISESPYSHQAVAGVMPLRDLFTSLFFVSIGMLMDLRFLLAHPWLILAVTLIALGIKVLATGAAAFLTGMSLRVAVVVGLALGQVGEFSFLLSQVGIRQDLLSQLEYQVFLNVSILTMVLTPLAMALGRKVEGGVPGGSLGMGDVGGGRRKPHELKDHLVVVGYGLGGRGVTRAARAAGIPYLVLEMNPSTVRREQKQGEPIIYGDAVYPAVLDHVAIERARVMVVTIADPVATRRIVAQARAANPGLFILARTRFLQEIEALSQAGADEVVAEELETAVEIFERVLERFLVPSLEIERFLAELRAEHYGLLRDTGSGRPGACDLSAMLPEVEVVTWRVGPGSTVDGNTIGQLGLRKRHGVNILAVRRDMRFLEQPGPDTMLKAGDLVVALGAPADTAAAAKLFHAVA